MAFSGVRGTGAVAALISSARQLAREKKTAFFFASSRAFLKRKAELLEWRAEADAERTALADGAFFSTSDGCPALCGATGADGYTRRWVATAGDVAIGCTPVRAPRAVATPAIDGGDARWSIAMVVRRPVAAFRRLCPHIGVHGMRRLRRPPGRRSARAPCRPSPTARGSDVPIRVFAYHSVVSAGDCAKTASPPTEPCLRASLATPLARRRRRRRRLDVANLVPPLHSARRPRCRDRGGLRRKGRRRDPEALWMAGAAQASSPRRGVLPKSVALTLQLTQQLSSSAESGSIMPRKYIRAGRRAGRPRAAESVPRLGTFAAARVGGPDGDGRARPRKARTTRTWTTTPRTAPTTGTALRSGPDASGNGKSSDPRRAGDATSSYFRRDARPPGRRSRRGSPYGEQGDE